MKDSERMKNSQILFIRYCLLFVIWNLLFIFLSVAPAHAYWIQYDWSGGDSQFFWYDTTRYDTDIYIESDESPPAKGGNSWNDTAVKVIEGEDKDTGVLLSSTYDADSPVVWKTIEWNFPSNDNALTDASGSNPFSRGDSRLRKDEATGLVALWHFDEGEDLADGTSADDSTVYDESINNNSGIVHGCTWEKQTEPPTSTTYAVFGSALNFDASNGDSVVFGDVYNGVQTIEFWMNSDGTDSDILQLNEGSSADTVYVSGADEITTSFNSTIYVDGSSGSTSVSAGSWSHVAIIAGNPINASALKLGKTDAGYFSGAIDEIAIYSRAKTTDEIWQDARGTQIRLRTQTTSSILDGTGIADSPIGLWHFDNLGDSTSTTAYDSCLYTTKHDGTLTGGYVWYQWGVFGKCLSFDGSSGYVDYSGDIGDVKSIEFWMNSDGDDSAILQLNDHSPADTVYISDDGNIETSFGDTIIYVNGSSGYSVSTGSWHHVAITTDNPIIADAVTLGKAGTGYFSGLIDELGLYNYVRTSTQIKIDAREGQPWSPWSPYYKKGDEDDIVLFADDFNDGNVGSDWIPVSGTDGTWLIDKAYEDSGVLEITDLSAPNDTGIIQADDANWYNYQVEVRVKLEANTQAGVLLNWNNAGSDRGYAAILDNTTDRLELYEMDANGAATSKAHHSFSPSTDQWYTLKAQYDGSKIRVYLGDTNYITYPSSTSSLVYTYKGYAGLIAANASAYFDDFKVHPIDRYVRYEATLTDNVNNDTTPYLYWVRLGYEETTRDDTLWSRIWQDKDGIHAGTTTPTWAPKDEDSGGIWDVLNYAEIDSADTTWCYNLENYDDNEDGTGPDGELRVFVEVPATVTDHVNLRLGYRKTAALTTPGTWSDNETDYKWDDGDDWISFTPGTVGVCDKEYTCSDTEVWKCTFSVPQITDNFSKEAGYILWSRAVSSEGNTEPSPETFEPDSSGNRQDTSIIYMMRDITPPGASNTSGGWPGHIGESGYQPVSGINNNNWIVDSLQIEGVQNTNPGPPPPEDWYSNSKNTWINYDSQDDSGIMVEVRDKNPDSTRSDDCSGLKEKSFDDSPTRYVYSTTACGREWRHPDYVSPIDITDIDDWAECDTDYNTAILDDIRYLALGTTDCPMPNLGTRSSKQGRDILIQFAQKDKAGNWGYSHPDYDEYQADDSPGYYINYDITKPVPRIISAPREANYSTSASFGFDDNSADDSALFCGFSTRLERNNRTDKDEGAYSVITVWTDYALPHQLWPPISDKGSASPSSVTSPYWYRFSVKAKDEALNESEKYDTYYFQCLAPVPDTIIYSGPSGIVTSSSESYSATFKFEGEGGTSPYVFAYNKDGNGWVLTGSAGAEGYMPLPFSGYGNHTFRVRAANFGGNPVTGDSNTDQTPASVTFTIVNPAQPPTIAPPSNPVKYWRQESE